MTFLVTLFDRKVFKNLAKMDIFGILMNFCPLKMSQLNIVVWHFPPKLTCLVTLFDRKLQVFKKLAEMDHFWHF